MNEFLSLPSDSSVVDSIVKSLIRAWMIFSRLPKASLYDDRNILWFSTGFDDPLLNGVLRTEFESSEAISKIEFIKSYFQQQKTPFCWHIGPTTKPDNLEHYLKLLGFEAGEETIGMAVDLSRLNEDIKKPDGLSFIRTENEETLQEWVNVLKEAYPLTKPFTDAIQYLLKYSDSTPTEENLHYLALLNSEPVATATLSLSEGVASIYDVSTLPNVRNRGFGSLITLYPLLDAREKGFKVGVLQSSEKGFSVYKRIGFQEYCRFRNYIYYPA